MDKRKGDLTTITGPVQSAKSTELRSILIRKQGAGFNIKLIEHKDDIRYVSLSSSSSSSCSSSDNDDENNNFLRQSSTTHLGDRCGINDCIATKNLSTIPDDLLKNIDYIGIDEGQFFDDNLVPFVTNQLNQGVHVIVAGLLTDFKLDAFKNIEKLQTLATYKKDKLGTCNAKHRSNKRKICGRDAPRSWKIGGNLDLNVEIGGPDMYRPVCTDCYDKLKAGTTEIMFLDKTIGKKRLFSDITDTHGEDTGVNSNDIISITPSIKKPATKPSKIVAIVGYREYNDFEQMSKILDKVLSNYLVIKIHTGDCRGTDTMVSRYAKNKNIECQIFNADWNTYGKHAGPKRNERLIEYVNLVIAFMNPQSKGTLNTVNLAKQKDIETIIYDV